MATKHVVEIHIAGHAFSRAYDNEETARLAVERLRGGCYRLDARYIRDGVLVPMPEEQVLINGMYEVAEWDDDYYFPDLTGPVERCADPMFDRR